MIVTRSKVLYVLTSVSALVALGIVYKASLLMGDGSLGMTASTWTILAILAILFALVCCLVGFIFETNARLRLLEKHGQDQSKPTAH